ncbi:MAG: class I SAM-dependent methyltransferase [Pirellulales bacterium]|nr:class I SAM-dependent methyltransferase [Pirellulales bacterium]
MHYQLLLCADCDLLYASPVPDSGSLAEAYRDAAYDSSLEAACAARTYARLLTPLLNRLPDRVGALDIGTGDGAFLKELLAFGFSEVRGVEPSSAPIAAAADHVRPLIHQAPFRRDDFLPQSLRLVTCFQTLEHVPAPLELARGAFSLLKDGGVMFCVVHNCRALSARILGRRSPIYDIEHLQLFSPRSVHSLFRAAGFQDIRTKIILNRYPVKYWTKLFPLPASVKNSAIAAANALRIGWLPLTLPAGNLAVVGFRTRPK